MSGLKYRPEIDGLRAIAVLSVLLYHADARLLPGGFVGVDIFFVISGYLITLLLVREWDEHGRIDLAAFYARRLRRLMPAMWLVVVATACAALFLLPPVDSSLSRFSDSVMASVLYLANFHFQGTTGGYFDGPSEELPLLHLWSLAVEEQYYLVYPALLLLLFSKGVKRLATPLVILCVASLLLAEHWLQVSPEVAFYQMPARFWELGAGALVAIRPSARPARAAALLAVGGFALVAYAIFATNAGGHFPGIGAAPAVIGAALILLALHGSTGIGPVGRLLGSRPLVAIGLLSYSLYLWHWPILAIDSATRLEPPGTAWRLALCGLAFVLAWATYRFVEVPWRRGPASSRQVLVVGAGMTAAMLLLGFGLPRLPMGDDQTSRWITRTIHDQPANMDRCHVRLSSTFEALNDESCNSVPGKRASIISWGDSHALAWQPFAWELARVRGESAASYTLDACPPVLGLASYRADHPAHQDTCLRFNQAVYERIRAGGIDTVVMAGRWPARFGDGLPSPREQAAPLRSGDRPMDKEELAAALRRTVLAVSPLVRQVILIGPVPVLKHDAARCIAVRRLESCASTRAEFDAMAAETRRRLSDAAQGLGNVTIVDPVDFFCTATDCPMSRDGYSLFWDRHHIALSAATAFSRQAIAADPALARLPGQAPRSTGRRDAE